MARDDSGLGRLEVPRFPNSRIAAQSLRQHSLHSFRQHCRIGPQRILFRLQLHLRELPGRLCQVGCYVHTAAALGHSYGQFDAVVVHHRARCTVVDIAAADTAVVDHVHPGLIVELVAAGRAHVLWGQSCALVVAAVAIADDIVGFAEIAGSEEALVSEGTAYSARGRYMTVDVPMIRRIQLTHPCELRAHQMLEQILQSGQHTLVREIVV